MAAPALLTVVTVSVTAFSGQEAAYTFMRDVSRCPFPEVENGQVETADRVRHNVATVICNKDSTKDGAAQSTCISAAVWYPPLAKCYKNCESPNIANSRQFNGNGMYPHGKEILCTDRHTIPNQGRIRCHNGKWQWDKQSAEPDGKIECPVPNLYCTCETYISRTCCVEDWDLSKCPTPEVSNGQVKTDKGNEVHSRATIECSEGYTCSGGRTCQSKCGHDGFWFPPLPQCHAKCKAPDIANSVMRPSDTEYPDGALFTVMCKDGFSAPYGWLLRCHDGHWTWANPEASSKSVTCEPEITSGTTSTHLHTGHSLSVVMAICCLANLLYIPPYS